MRPGTPFLPTAVADEHLLPHPQKLPHRILHLGVPSPIAHPPDPFVDPLGRMLLLPRQRFVLQACFKLPN